MSAVIGRGRRVLLFGNERSPHTHKWVGYLESAGASVDVVGYGEGAAPDSFAYTSLVARGEAARTRSGKLAAAFADAALLRSTRYDAVWLHFLTDRLALYAMLSRAPVALTCWGSDILVDLKKARGASRFLRITALRRAARITADSEDVLAAVEALAPGAARKSRLVFWGVDSERFQEGEPGASGLRGELRLPPDAVVLLSNRLCSPHYRIEEIVRRFAEAAAEPGVFLIVRAQPGCDPGYLVRCKAAASGSRNVLFLERSLADAELPALYRTADAVLHYPKTDATPVSMLEALACGRAVLCSDQVPSYERLAESYAITRAPLETLDAALARRLAAERPNEAARNREALLQLHSRERTVIDVAAALEETVAAWGGSGRGTRRADD